MAVRQPIIPVILSGGSGTRLWPVSRHLFPKQLLPLLGERSLLQETAARLSAAHLFAAPILVANEEHRFIIAEQLRQIGVNPAAMLLEPEPRNTAPAIALAALRIAEEDGARLMLVLPSDHVIRDVAAFHAAVEVGAGAAAAGRLVTFGIVPDRPETGYGYIERGRELGETPGVFEVAAFVEKPDAKRAEAFLADGRHAWNSGMFLFSADAYLAELARHAPAMLEACRAAMEGRSPDLGFERPDAAAFSASAADSIDYAVMEKTDRAALVPVDMGWSDVGSWRALWDLAEKDAHGNATFGDVLAEDCTGSLLQAHGPAIAAIGLEDMIVVTTKDAVLVAPKSRAQDVKRLVARLADEGRTEHLSHPLVYRPWGSYETTDAGPRFQTKRIIVKPGAKLSLQKHNHRAEHWVVVQGTARVTCDDKVMLLTENQSTYIPLGAVHRLENPGKIPLHLIEVQSGAYLGEDDIERLEDTYGRG
ncbi:MAG: mannose-1-phosphate guanylyltransferase/mannose-6-phosphate isomerase [Rhodothalassiaceae bacterium]